MLFLLMFLAKMLFLEKMLIKIFYNQHILKAPQPRSQYIWKQWLEGACAAPLWGKPCVFALSYKLKISALLGEETKIIQE